MRVPRCFWVAGIGQGKAQRPCIVLHSGDGWLLTATGTSQPHPERGRLISVPAQSRAGKALGLRVDTFFDPWSFTTRLTPNDFEGEGMFVGQRLLNDLLDLFHEAVAAQLLRTDNDPQLALAAAALVTP